MNRLERALVLFGVLCLGWYGLAAADAAWTEHKAREAVERALASAVKTTHVPPPLTAPPVSHPPSAPGVARGRGVAKNTAKKAATPERAARTAAGDAVSAFDAGIVGLLEIPRLGVSTPVVEGDDAHALRGAAGHLPDTPRPWEHGNSAIAAHRDGLFRPLRNIRVGDRVRVRTPHGEIAYRVKDTQIVRPTDLSVLEQTKRSTLTLITCYPFYYVGAAPKRFVVRAEKEGG